MSRLGKNIKGAVKKNKGNAGGGKNPYLIRKIFLACLVPVVVFMAVKLTPKLEALNISWEMEKVESITVLGEQRYVDEKKKLRKNSLTVYYNLFQLPITSVA